MNGPTVRYKRQRAFAMLGVLAGRLPLTSSIGSGRHENHARRLGPDALSALGARHRRPNDRTRTIESVDVLGHREIASYCAPGAQLVRSRLCESPMPAITISFQSCGGPSRRSLMTDARATSKPFSNASCNDSRDGSFLRL